ncbi:NAD(P)-dependent dehydrogenase (short-subunit alcohol dehydrogenase family) [Bacillus sp. V2I10]|nr:NAD(P)-dependent dehydrogenase (short-subunit alcohol dehydrogenase family) [Bacillus sp. V2I10]
MKDKVMIVTGGSSGMGKAMAESFARQGANVVITGRTIEKLEAAKEEMIGLEGKIIPFQMDVRVPEMSEELIRKTDEAFGHIDGLVNNAAGNFICPAEQLSVNGWNSVINIVLNGTFYCSSAAGKYWIEKQQKGAILNMVATYACGSRRGSHSFCCCKGRSAFYDKNACCGMGKKIWNPRKRDSSGAY